MFTAKSALYLSDDVQLVISPITNIESLYIEKASKQEDGKYIVKRLSVAKHFPIALFVRNNNNITISDIESSTLIINNTQTVKINDSSIIVYNIYVLNINDKTDNMYQFKEAIVKKIDLSDILYSYASKTYFNEYITALNIDTSNKLTIIENDASSLVLDTSNNITYLLNNFINIDASIRKDENAYDIDTLMEKCVNGELIPGIIYKCIYDISKLDDDFYYTNDNDGQSFYILLKAINKYQFSTTNLECKSMYSDSSIYINNLRVNFDITKYNTKDDTYIICGNDIYLKINIDLLYNYEISDGENTLKQYTNKKCIIDNIKEVYIKIIAISNNTLRINVTKGGDIIIRTNDFYNIKINNKLLEITEQPKNIIYISKNSGITYMKDMYGNIANFDFLNKKQFIIENDSIINAYLFSYEVYDQTFIYKNALLSNNNFDIKNNIVNSNACNNVFNIIKSLNNLSCKNNYIGYNNIGIIIRNNNDFEILIFKLPIINNIILYNNSNIIINGSNNLIRNNNSFITCNGDNNIIYNNNTNILPFTTFMFHSLKNIIFYNNIHNITYNDINTNSIIFSNNSSIYLNTVNNSLFYFNNNDISISGNNNKIKNNNEHLYINGNNNTINNTSTFGKYEILNCNNVSIDKSIIAINYSDNTFDEKLKLENTKILNLKLLFNIFNDITINNSNIINSEAIYRKDVKNVNISNSILDIDSSLENCTIVNSAYKNLCNLSKNNTIINSDINSEYGTNDENNIIINYIDDKSITLFINNEIYNDINIVGTKFIKINKKT